MARLTNCKFAGNKARICGGGMHDYRSTSQLTNCTFVGDSAQKGSALIYESSQQYPARVDAINCILWDGNDAIWIGDGTIITITYNDVQGGWPGVDNINADPCFVEPGYWADVNDSSIVLELNDPNAVWIDGDYHLLPDSPCIDAGDPYYISEPNETDLDGNPRVLGGRIDMGVYEAFLEPLDLLIELSKNVNAMNLQKGIANNLQVKLDAAIRLLEDINENNDVASINSLQAFINAVEARYGKKILEADAAALIAAAQEIIELLSND